MPFSVSWEGKFILKKRSEALDSRVKNMSMRAIPCLYYHSVGDHPYPRPKSHLSLSLSLFEQQMLWLLERRFATVFLRDLYDYMAGRRSLIGREIALTFDDGFLDNWVFVWPLAMEMGFRFTVFINPEFVDPRDVVRPTLADVWAGDAKQDDLEWWGFLSWPELRLMEKSGLVDIQSHALTHTCYPADASVIDFHHPGDSYYWLVWNSRPETKPFWLSHYDEALVPYGTPVHTHQKSLVTRRFFPDPRLANALATRVRSNGGKRLFENPAWRGILRQELDRLRIQIGDEGHLETSIEQKARVRYEIIESKERIEKELGKKVEFLCWPGGGESPLARRLALEVGYRATTKGSCLNRPLADPSHIQRLSSWFGAPIPQFIKWRLFEGQVDRGSGRLSPASLAAVTLSRLYRLHRMRRGGG